MRQNKVGEPKSFKLFGHFSLAILLSVSSLNAGSFEDFKRTQAESFTKYKDERDNAFNNYLKAEFKAYKAYKSAALYEEPKPKTIPSTTPKDVKSVGPKVHIKIKPLQKTPPPVEVVSTPKPVEIKKDLYIEFFGSKLGFDIPQKIKDAKYYPQTQKGIMNFFDKAASSNYELLLSEINLVIKEMNLNDWGKYLLINKVAQKVFVNTDDAKLLTWFLFNKLGYAVKVGLSGKHLVLMYYSKKIIYSTPNYNFGNKKFYVIANYAKGKVGKLYSYDHDYPGADRALDLSLNTLPNFVKSTKNKQLHFKEFGKEYQLEFVYNQNLIDFMATYPQADYATYFNAPVENDTYKSIAQGLKKYVDSKRISDAMNFVLHFVQNAFEYERDNEQFGREKVMFAEETLYYDKSDCEDRAVLYAYLIKELFGISVIGVKYKDHMATALYVPMEGDAIKENGKKFVIADPTYINASIGQSMPKYKSIRPESFIIVKKT